MNLCYGFQVELGALLGVLVLNNGVALSFEERPLCTATHNTGCVVLCRGWDLGWNRGARELNEILMTQGKRFRSCTLILENCTRGDDAWADDINSEKKPKIVELKIFHSPIDFNELNLKSFKNLRRITAKNTTTAVLRSEAFRRLPKLEQLRIQKTNLLKRVESGFLQNLSVRYLQIQGITLDPPKTVEFFRNLTGGREIPSVRGLDWSHNRFGNFAKDLLAPFTNLKVLLLTNSGIFNFEEETFTNRTVQVVKMDKNRIRRLPENVFRPLMEVVSVASLEGNSLICDCEMTWLQSLAKTRKLLKNFNFSCAYPQGLEFFEGQMCPERNSESSTIQCAPQKNFAVDYNSWFDAIKSSTTFNNTSTKFIIKNDEPKFIVVDLLDVVDVEKTVLWYGNYAKSTSPHFTCVRLPRQRYYLPVRPETNYLICLANVYELSKIDVFDCLPFKTKPLYGNQAWLTNKSISITISLVFLGLLFAVAMGALILYFTVRKNPSLIRGSKRVIEVKRHDKAQILVMPRGYENLGRAETSSLAPTNPHLPLEPPRSSLSCDTISTVSYVSANQPTQMEILTYRLSRLRELFQRNYNLPQPVSPIPMQITVPSNQRLPPDVDLLFEYEWYTITTTTTTNA